MVGLSSDVHSKTDQPEAAATARARRHPNFFIVGAARSGTTALWHYLRQHPDVFLPKSKEPHYFCAEGPAWAVRNADEYLALFDEAGDAAAVGEASTGYFCAADSPHLIRTHYPDARIIIMLRDPVERAHSLYRLNCSAGIEWLSTFERALDAEEERATSDDFHRRSPAFWGSYLYFRSGLSAEHLARFQAAFPPSQLHVIVYDDFRERTLEVTQQVYRFIGVDPAFTPKTRVVHASEFPLSTHAQYWLKRAVARRIAGGDTTSLLIKALSRAFFLNLRAGSVVRRNTVRSSTKRALRHRYRDDVETTGRLLGRDLSAWLAPPEERGRP